MPGFDDLLNVLETVEQEQAGDIPATPTPEPVRALEPEKPAKKGKAKKEAKPQVPGWMGRFQKTRDKYRQYNVVNVITGALPSGSLALDLALGVGGYAYGSLVKITGNYGTGKTALVLAAVKEQLAAGRPVIYFDTEGATNDKFLRRAGIDPDNPLFAYYSSQSMGAVLTYEILTQIVEDFLAACTPAKGEQPIHPLIAIDSISNLITGAEFEAKITDSVMASQARLNGRWMKEIWVALRETEGVMIFTEQYRAKMNAQQFENPYTQAGGFAIRYQANVSLDLIRLGQIKPKDDIVGHVIGVRIEKNRVDIPFRRASYVLRYVDMGTGTGIDRFGELVALGVLAGFVEKKGGWYTLLTYCDENGEYPHGQGDTALKEFLATYPDVAADLERKIRGALLTSEGMDTDAESNDEQ